VNGNATGMMAAPGWNLDLFGDLPAERHVGFHRILTQGPQGYT
jgi:hypothetical protein